MPSHSQSHRMPAGICAWSTDSANNLPGKLRDPSAAQALYMHCRFACIACDHNWLEDLIVGAMDRIEEVVMVCLCLMV